MEYGCHNRRRLRFLRISMLAVAAAAVVLPAADARAAFGVKHFCVMVPMRDGTRLATDVYLPRVPKAAVPAILMRTPYGRHLVPKIAAAACTGGSVVVYFFSGLL